MKVLASPPGAADVVLEAVPKSNAEGQDLPEPLPAWSKEDLKEVKLYGSEFSPPCAKIRAILSYFGVPYTRASKKTEPPPDPSYTKIPVLVINGHQINDSFIMVKELAKILMGKSMDANQITLEKDQITYGAMLALEVEAFGSAGDLRKFAHAAIPTMSMWQTALLWCLSYPMSIVLPYLLRSRLSSKTELLKVTGVQDSQIYGSALAQELGNGPFFGGSEPGMLDLSLYGVVLPFKQAGASVADRFLDGSKLRDWWNKMSAAFGGKEPVFQPAS